MIGREFVSARERLGRTVHAGLTVAMLALAIGACARPPVGSGRSCAPVPVDRMLAPTPGQVELLAGRYRILVVTTVGASNPSRNSTTWDVVLERPDSARLALARGRPFGRGSRIDLRLVGIRRGEGSPPVPVEWDDGMLITGCLGCERTSTDFLMIESVADEGFRGSWIRIPPADGRMIDLREEPPRLQSGYFCAVRTAPR